MLAGYDVEIAEDGLARSTQVEQLVPDAVVLDVGLPGMTGSRSAARCAREGNRVPVLMLTARDAVADRIDGLDAGADDYLVKPFDIGELKARLRALLRRAGAARDRRAGLRGAPARPGRHGVRVGDTFVELTRTEYQLLELLMLNPRRVLPHSSSTTACGATTSARPRTGCASTSATCGASSRMPARGR